MSVLPPKADIDPQSANVRFVPKGDMRSAAKSRLFKRANWDLIKSGKAF
jgi:hypothetical protein